MTYRQAETLVSRGFCLLAAYRGIEGLPGGLLGLGRLVNRDDSFRSNTLDSLALIAIPLLFFSLAALLWLRAKNFASEDGGEITFSPDVNALVRFMVGIGGLWALLALIPQLTNFYPLWPQYSAARPSRLNGGGVIAGMILMIPAFAAFFYGFPNMPRKLFASVRSATRRPFGWFLPREDLFDDRENRPDK